MKDQENFFRIVGMKENSAKLLSLIIRKPNLKIEKLSSELGLDYKSCDSLIQELVSSEIIEITSDETIRITHNFASDTVRKLENSVENFTDQLRATRFLTGEKYVEEIEDIFQRRGYTIRREITRVRILEFNYRFIAEKFYRFGIFIIGPENLEQKEYPLRFLQRILVELEEISDCIGTFLFFDPKLNKSRINLIKRELAIESDRSPYQRTGKFFFVHNIRQNIEEFLEENLNEIERRHDIAEEHFKKIKEEMKITKDLIVENSMMISQLNSLASGQYLPGLHKDEQFMQLIIPVKSVVDREERNLEIFERKCEEENTILKRMMDDFDKRLILPNVTNLKEKARRIEELKSKFTPIRHELRFLMDLILLPYVAKNEPMRINPFLLTEPNDIETLTINQDNMKFKANRFFDTLKSGGSNLLFLVGAAGMGKTHVLKHIFCSHAKELNIWPIYVDCPMKYDIVSSLFVEIVQERNFPQKVHSFLPTLRKMKVSTGLEFADVIKRLHDMMCKQGYEGFFLIIDELENSLPYSYDKSQYEKFSEVENIPLAMKQLREIISSDLIT